MEPLLSENAKLVLEKRYLSQDPLGNVVETPKEMFQRVARAVASIEKKEKQKWEKRFFKLMTALKFLPNSPTLMNAGKPHGQLSACYVLPIEDSLDGIFETLKYAAKIHQSGGGTGFSFSRLRSSGSQVKTSRGIASGPVSFMKIYDETTEIIKQGGVRRGANMAVLRADHPDIFEFINSKRDQKSICNFNISVGATEDFMCALMNDKSFILKEPNGKAVKEVKATELFDNIVQSAWECGDPGLVFLDRINLFNPTPKCGEIESTNPCGEQPLLPYESCNLGSLNVGAYVKENGFDWDGFYDDIKIAVRFLDNVIDINFFPITKSKKITLKNRKIGLGVMGFADALLLQKIPYDSESAVCFGEKLMSFLDHVAKLASHELAKQKGRFPNWKGSLWDHLGYPYLRNATVSTVAPTGTISMIAGCSSGIEPIFSDIYYKNVLSGEKLLEV
ncbi:MAG: adenosylcobalamin-dependent ribonucleoside-diphosphate reductase, partial [Bdellovibrio sp.]|nr:adenosylcobalamin-dependent ribonucleoside-diphosphate reductase [Bdellovibrio sp.]